MLRRPTPDRWLALGGALATLSAAAATAIWQSNPKGGYWHLPGIAALSILAAGVLMMLVGFFKSDTSDRPGRQAQRGGAHSTNLQAGRDIQITGSGPDDGDEA